MIYFLRHAETDYNYRNIVSGRSDTSIRYKSFLLHNSQEFELIYSSPSRRCVETISCLRNNSIIPQYDDRLLERYMGTLEGKSKDNIRNEFPELFKEANQKIYFNLFETPPGGESFYSFYERVYSFYRECIVLQNRNILICSHNQTLKMLFFIYTNIPITFDAWTRINIPNGKIIAMSDLIHYYELCRQHNNPLAVGNINN